MLGDWFEHEFQTAQSKGMIRNSKERAKPDRRTARLLRLLGNALRRRLHLPVEHSFSPRTKVTPARRSTDETYRSFRLLAGQRGDGFSSAAYAGKNCVFAGSGSDLDGALDDIKTQIDEDFARRAVRLNDNRLSVADFELALALSERRITPALQHVLEMLADGEEVSMAQIERRAGAGREVLIDDILRLARAIARVFAIDLPRGADKARSALHLIVEQIIGRQSADEAWTFRASFVEAAQRYLNR